jgi:radical SAM/Cys-rich protein
MTTLTARHHPLAVAHRQLEILDQRRSIPEFSERLRAAGAWPLRRAAGIRVLQINVGKLCNQTCRHCHVDAGPDRTEIMSRPTMQLCLERLAASSIPIVDITGGAPELNPDFRWLVEQVRELNRHVIDRCNLTVLLLSAQSDLIGFLARHRVEVIASLPYYLGERTDAQRGTGVFDRSIEALRRLNSAGYGRAGTGLLLNLVYNPVGAFLPPRQEAIEGDYRRELQRRFGIEFNRLYTITNMPINRFLEYLIETGNYEGYMQRLAGAFNPQAVAGLMCRETLSIGWDGSLHDCDFNQMLELPLSDGLPRHIRDLDPAALSAAAIATGRHCFGCTAGAGSSCGGALA